MLDKILWIFYDFQAGIYDAISMHGHPRSTDSMLRYLKEYHPERGFGKLYDVGYLLFCQRGNVKGDCLAGYILLSMLFVALLIGIAMYM